MKWELPLLIIAAVGCYLLIRLGGKDRHDESRAAKLMKKYATLTPDLLAATPDEELVEAVVCHVLSRAADNRRPNPTKELADLPRPFTVVYSIWAVCKELARTDYVGLTHTATRHLVDGAVEGLPVVGAPLTAAALTAMRDGYSSKEGADLDRAFHQAVEQECPLTLCVAYIRDHVNELTDTEVSDEE